MPASRRILVADRGRDPVRHDAKPRFAGVRPQHAPAVLHPAVLGRQGLAVADNLHHVLDMALAAAACLDGGRGANGWDAARWAAQRRRFDDFVVDD